MAREAELKKQRVFNTGNGVAKLVWNNANRVNHANHFVPRPVQLIAVRQNVNSVRPNVNTGRANINSVRQNVNFVRSNVNTGSFNINIVKAKQPIHTSNSNSFSPVRPQGNWGTAVKTSAGYNWRKTRPNSNCNSGSNFIRTVNAKGPQGRPKPEKAWILLKVPRQHNMYSFDMKTPALTKDYACLIAKATSDESKLWHRRFSWVFFLATKDKTSGILHNFIRQIENQLNHRVKIIRSDNDTEFKNRDMLEFCGNNGIKQEYSNARTPQQNGVTERMNTTLIEAARTMLRSLFVPPAVRHTASKVGPRKSLLQFTRQNTPEILAFRRELDKLVLKHLREVPKNKSTSTTSVNSGSGSINSQHAGQDDSDMPKLTIFNKPHKGIFDEASYDDEGMVYDFNNLPIDVAVSPIPTLRIHNIHPQSQILDDPKSSVQTRSRVQQHSGAHALVSYVQKQQRNNHKDQTGIVCIPASYLTEEPKKITEALKE
ncbi:putative ribonuclease H-like domain-containing protein [Tanacetum coccineum]